MATENTKKTGREKLLERLRGRNPELNIEDDEAVSGQISADYDMLDQREDERNKFKDMLSSNPYAAPIITGLATGKNDDGTDFDLAEWFIDNEPDMLIDMIEGNPKTKERYIKMLLLMLRLISVCRLWMLNLMLQLQKLATNPKTLVI